MSSIQYLFLRFVVQRIYIYIYKYYFRIHYQIPWKSKYLKNIRVEEYELMMPMFVLS